MNHEHDKRSKRQQHGKKVIERQHRENQQTQLNQQNQLGVAASSSSSSSSRHVRSNTGVGLSSAHASDASDESDHIEHETCTVESSSRSKDVEMQVKSCTSVPLEIVANHDAVAKHDIVAKHNIVAKHDIVACETEIHGHEKKRSNHFEKEGIIKALERYGVHDLLDEEKGNTFGMERLQYTIDDVDNADEIDTLHERHSGSFKQRLLFHDCCAPNQNKRRAKNKRTCAQNFSNACPSHLVALSMCICFLVIMSVIALVIVECKEKYQDVEWKIQYLESSMQNISSAMGIPMQPFVQKNTSLFSKN